MGVILPILLILFTCLIIWRACDGFEIASEYIGRNLSEGVRGGTINAISSSIPELLTTLIALFVITGDGGAASNEAAFSVGIGTTAGSALFNGMIIPAVCILTVVGTTVLGRRVNSVNVSTKVLLRDGLSLIFCELVLVLFINGTKLYWWHGLILCGLYAGYFAYMLLSMKDVGDEGDEDGDEPEEDEPEEDEPEEDEARGFWGGLFYWLSLGPLLDLESVFVTDSAKKKIREQTWNGWPLLLVATAIIAAACWLLVEACEWLGSGPEHPHYLFGVWEVPHGLDMPIIFVAVIFASMATSVPDTVMSIRDARDGDYDDAVANALGSNIFDICFALGFPLLLYTLVFRKPIEMGEEVAARSAELRFVLLMLTIVGFFIYYLGPRTTGAGGATCVEMKRGKAFALLSLYAAFAAYVLCLGFGLAWATGVSDWLRSVVLQNLPKLS